ncbi:putative sugar nucleotidyl transferase [Danxiaibacter flavus]|uniref:Sugar nucleotidyl transferase n=1 Tax=Danxiaibacter flavus TaxID=3049108 RepID=A0ABV3ZEH8_9BACT|nr:putative sugar nucleotidyl transferase [Chitinophagaceae bacterium DXS]
MPIVLFDGNAHKGLLPLTYTRSVAGIRMGAFTMQERWERITGEKIYVQTEGYLSALYEAVPDRNNLFIDAAVLPDAAFVELALSLNTGNYLSDQSGQIIAIKHYGTSINAVKPDGHAIQSLAIKRIEHPWNIFQWNGEMIAFDFALLTKGRKSATVSPTNHLIKAENIFIEEGAVVECSVLNASEGPIYIGKDALVMEGSLIRGPFALGENAVLKMGSKIYGASTVGPHCVAGGEIKNAVMHSYSNKAHDGYLGDSVIGAWCNMGAGTSNSNVKNNASAIKMPSQTNDSFLNAGLKCGVIMGDYTRTAINTSINTGTLTGVSCNVFGAGLTPHFIPSFCWGMDGEKVYQFDRALADIENWKKFKQQSLSNAEADVLKYIFDNFL